MCTKAEGTSTWHCFLLLVASWGQSYSAYNSQFLFQKPYAPSKWHQRKPQNNYTLSAWKCTLFPSQHHTVRKFHSWLLAGHPLLSSSRSSRAGLDYRHVVIFSQTGHHNQISPSKHTQPCVQRVQENPFYFRVICSRNRTSSKQTSSIDHLKTKRILTLERD